jgi:hypothetical protein
MFNKTPLFNIGDYNEALYKYEKLFFVILFAVYAGIIIGIWDYTSLNGIWFKKI